MTSAPPGNRRRKGETLTRTRPLTPIALGIRRARSQKDAGKDWPCAVGHEEQRVHLGVGIPEADTRVALGQDGQTAGRRSDDRAANQSDPGRDSLAWLPITSPTGPAKIKAASRATGRNRPCSARRDRSHPCGGSYVRRSDQDAGWVGMARQPSVPFGAGPLSASARKGGHRAPIAKLHQQGPWRSIWAPRRHMHRLDHAVCGRHAGRLHLPSPQMVSTDRPWLTVCPAPDRDRGDDPGHSARRHERHCPLSAFGVASRVATSPCGPAPESCAAGREFRRTTPNSPILVGIYRPPRTAGFPGLARVGSRRPILLRTGFQCRRKRSGSAGYATGHRWSIARRPVIAIDLGIHQIAVQILASRSRPSLVPADFGADPPPGRTGIQMFARRSVFGRLALEHTS